MKTLIFFGIGSNSFANLSTVSFAIESDLGNWILVDCGPDTPRQIKKAGIRYGSISHVILTHRHFDHCLGLPYLIFGRNLERSTLGAVLDEKLHIISEASLFGSLMNLVSFCHPDSGISPKQVEHVEITSLTSPSAYSIGDLAITFSKMIHTVPTFGFTAVDRTGSLAYSSDTLPCPEFTEAARGSDILIHEAMVPESEKAFSMKAMHSTALDAGEVAALVAPGKGFLVHLRPQFWTERSQLEQEASAAAGIRLTYPTELDRIVFK